MPSKVCSLFFNLKKTDRSIFHLLSLLINLFIYNDLNKNKTYQRLNFANGTIFLSAEVVS